MKNINKTITTCLLLFGLISFAQVKIGDNPTSIGTSSALELESTNKALLLSRVANTAAIASPTNGMLIYDISSNCIKGYENGAWTACIGLTSQDVLAQIGNEGDSPNTVPSVVTVAQINIISPAISGAIVANQTAYQAYIDANPNSFSSPATAAEVQAMINAVNSAVPTSNGTALVSAYSCSTASAGTMTAGIEVSGVTQTITATVTTVGTYSISSTANGVTFAASGTFAGTGAQNIVLTASGTPTAAGTHSFTLDTTPNCSFTR